MSNIENVIIIGDVFDYTGRISVTIPNWISMLTHQLNTNIIDLTYPGAGTSYNIIKFLKNKEDFDLCIFVWTDVYGTLYHDDVYDLNLNTARQPNLRKKDNHPSIYNAANLYYTNLISNPITYIEHICLLKGFDTHIKQQYSDKLFWHFYLNTTSEISENELLFYNFTQGLTIYPTVDKINNMDSEYVCDKLKNVIDTNHTSNVFILNE